MKDEKQLRQGNGKTRIGEMFQSIDVGGRNMELVELRHSCRSWTMLGSIIIC